MDIGKIIADLRRERHLTQQDLGEILNLSPGTISNYEHNVHEPDLASLNMLADFFHVTVDYLLGRTDYRFPAQTLRENLCDNLTISDIANTILALDKKSQNSVIKYIEYISTQKQPEQ